MALLSLERTVINHFKETGPGLIALDTREVIDPKITVWGKPLLMTKLGQ